MFDVRLPVLRSYAFEGNFGLERESLRVTEAGRMAQTPHPFPPDHPRIVRDFCENQTEINTGVHPTAEAAVAELKEIDATIRAAILPRGERLWTNSNPPASLEEDEIVPAKFDGHLAGKSTYRDYLADKYGKALMAYCGIHVNFSFGEKLVEASGVDRDVLYLQLASQCIKWGWAIVALTAASPRGDYSSVRCSERGYWNKFIPILDFSSVRDYARSIARYVQDGQLVAPSELYYPIRLKPRGQNRLQTLVEGEMRGPESARRRTRRCARRRVRAAVLPLVRRAAARDAFRRKAGGVRRALQGGGAARLRLDAGRRARREDGGVLRWVPGGACDSRIRGGEGVPS